MFILETVTWIILSGNRLYNNGSVCICAKFKNIPQYLQSSCGLLLTWENNILFLMQHKLITLLKLTFIVWRKSAPLSYTGWNRWKYECLMSPGTCLLSTEPCVWTCANPVWFGWCQGGISRHSLQPPLYSSSMTQTCTQHLHTNVQGLRLAVHPHFRTGQLGPAQYLPVLLTEQYPCTKCYPCIKLMFL